MGLRKKNVFILLPSSLSTVPNLFWQLGIQRAGDEKVRETERRPLLPFEIYCMILIITNLKDYEDPSKPKNFPKKLFLNYNLSLTFCFVEDPFLPSHIPIICFLFTVMSFNLPLEDQQA